MNCGEGGAATKQGGGGSQVFIKAYICYLYESAVSKNCNYLD